MAFDFFDPEKIARYKAVDVDRLMAAEGMIKNKGKIASGNYQCSGGYQNPAGIRFI